MNRKQDNRVSGGDSADPQRPPQRSRSPKCRLDPALSPTQSRARRQLQHWNLTQRPSHGSPLHRQMPGLLLALVSALCRICRFQRFQRANSRNATPVRACISPDLGSLSAFSGANPNAAPSTAPLRPSELRRHPQRMHLSNSLALKAQPDSFCLVLTLHSAANYVYNRYGYL
jgi:hypothetical protein